MCRRRFRLPSPALVVLVLALSVALGGTAFAANSAENATNSTNATNAANATSLEGVAASSYLTNSGSIFVSTGSSNWVALNTTDHIDFFYGDNGTSAARETSTSSRTHRSRPPCTARSSS